MATTTPGKKSRPLASEKAKARKFERSVKAMKKAVLKAQLALLDGVETDDQLQAAGRILSQAEYADVVEERYIARVCGFPSCKNALSPESDRKGRYRISLSAKKVYDLEESRHFCSSECLIASKDFGGKLPERQDVKVSKRTNSSDIAVQSGQRDDHASSSELKTTGEEARAVLKEGVQRSERQQNGAGVIKEWESLISGSSQGDVSTSCITEVTNETRLSDLFSVEDTASSSSKGVRESPANLKPALKKKAKAKRTVRSVAWADQDTTEPPSRSGSRKSKVTARSVNSSADIISVEEKMKGPTVEEEQRPEARSSESSLDLAMAARLASAEALATALTEAATSAANGEVDGSEAVAQAGISIFSATHNASTTTSEAQVTYNEDDLFAKAAEAQSQVDTLDVDDLFAKAAEAREEMRRLKMPRKYSKLQDEKDGDHVDGDVVDDFKDEDDDDSDDPTDTDGDGAVDDDAADDEDDDDESGGFEGADEVGFTAPPKGFKAEVSKFGTMFMALEGWISAAAVAHIYGKEPHEEEEYLFVNGREYSRQVVIGDGLSAEISRSFSICVSRALPEVVRALRISVPMSSLELSLGRLIQALRFVEALPPFGTKEWRVLIVLLLDSLSVQRLPRLGVYFSNNRLMMRKVLDSAGTSEAEYDVFRDVVLPLGRSPTFSTLSGA